MAFQIKAKPQRKSISNYNCAKCGSKYKSLRSHGSNLDANIIQIIECQHCNMLGENLGNANVAELP